MNNQDRIKKQFDNLTELYQKYIDIFNDWEYCKNDDIDFFNLSRLQRIYCDFVDILEKAGRLEKVGIKSYKIIGGNDDNN